MLNIKNKFIKTDEYYIIEIDISKTVNRKFFNKDIVEIKFSTEEEERVLQIKNTTWYISKNKNSNKFYVRTNSFNKQGVSGFLHQIVLKKEKEDTVIDHINGDSFDNRIENLREVSMAENSKNKKDKGYPKKVYVNGKFYGWRTTVVINSLKICLPTRKDYFQADVEGLIAQRFLGIKHREKDWDSIDIQKEYENSILEIVINKIEKTKNKKSSITKNLFEIDSIEKCIKIYDNKNNFCYISLEDEGILDVGRLKCEKGGYWSINTANKETYLLHRYLLGIKEKDDCSCNLQVDHINKKPYDNRRDNLVITTIRGNQSNKKSKGYYFHQNKFRVKYCSYWEYIKKFDFIDKRKQPTFNSKEEAENEVYVRKTLVEIIRPKFQSYEDFQTFKRKHSNIKDLDSIWIQENFDNINAIAYELLNKLY